MSSLHDRYGNELGTQSVAAQEAYLAGAESLMAATPGMDGHFRKAVEADENFALGHISLARAKQLLAGTSLILPALNNTCAPIPSGGQFPIFKLVNEAVFDFERNEFERIVKEDEVRLSLPLLPRFHTRVSLFGCPGILAAQTNH